MFIRSLTSGRRSPVVAAGVCALLLGLCTGLTCAQGVPEDCNGNGVPDSEDIANGTSHDENGDGIPDECCAPGAFSRRTYTLDGDFDEGQLLNLNHNPSDQLQLNDRPTPLPFVYVACSARGTLVRIDVNTCQVLAEYRTAPEGQGLNPSRTTVDQYGNCWVSNRAEFGVSPPGSGIQRGSVARVGIILGGTRGDKLPNGSFVANPNGQYLQGPFQYNTCVDRDGDGLFRTSGGLGDIHNWGSANAHGGVSAADDECIINYTRVRGTGTRTVAIDANNDVWVGGLGDRWHEKLDGVTGQPVGGTAFNLGCGGYGGLIGCDGLLWSARNLLRYDPDTASGICLGDGMGNYGLGIDPCTGNLWHSSHGGTLTLYEIDPVTSTVVNSYPQGLTCQGVAVDFDGHVWVAETFGTRVAHFAPDPNNAGQHVFVGNVTGLAGSTGVAVDSNGMIWVSEQQSSTTRGAARIDPSAGAIGGGGYPIGAIDCTVGLDMPGLGAAAPYNYSDMTGFVAIGATSPQGTWNVVHDGNTNGIDWGVVSWNSSEPAGTGILVEVRAADDPNQLPAMNFVPVSNNVSFAGTGVTGRYLEVRVTLFRDQQDECNCSDLTPVLFDLTIQTAACMEICPIELACVPDGSNSSDYTFQVTNLSGVVAHWAFLVAPPGITISPSTIHLVPPLGDGETRTITVNISGLPNDAPQEVCFTLALLDEFIQECCSDEVCVVVEPCCAEILTKTIECLPGGDFSVTFDLLNLTAEQIEHLFVVDPSDSVTISPNHLLINPPLAPGATITHTVTISGGTPGEELCLLISIHNADLEVCCAIEQCIIVPECGACCFENNGCMETDQATCESLGGCFLGVGSACVGNGLCPLGACCRPDGICLEINPCECLNIGGLFLLGEICSDQPCPSATGACCFCQGCDPAVSLEECDVLGGIFLGVGTDCANCPPVVTGACCGGPAGCEVRTDCDCQAIGGTFQGEGTTCDQGACCLPGACFDTDLCTCELDGGTFMPGVTCADMQCGLVATCLGDCNGDLVVDVQDLVAVILAWGPCGAVCPSDFNQDGEIDVQDMVQVILNWGVCP